MNQEENKMKNVISTDKAPAAIGPYSQAIEVNGMVYTSGIIPVVPATGEIPEGSVAQAKQAFENLSNLLEAAGTSMDKVVKTTVFIKEMNDFGAPALFQELVLKCPLPLIFLSHYPEALLLTPLFLNKLQYIQVPREISTLLLHPFFPKIKVN